MQGRAELYNIKIVQGRGKPRERKAHPCRCSCTGSNQLSKVHGDGTKLPVMVGAAEGQAKEKASGESEETEEVSGERGDSRTHQTVIYYLL